MTTSIVAPPIPTRLKPLPRLGRGKDVTIVHRGRRGSLLYQNAKGELVTKRARIHEDKERVSTFQLLRALIADPSFWSVAMTMPGNICNTGKRGRPTHNPSWAYLLIAGLTTLTGSQRAAITFINDPTMWKFLRQYTEAYRPKGVDSLGKTPPQRHHFSTFLKKWESEEWETIRHLAHKQFRAEAGARATSQGMLNPAQPLRYNEVDPGQHIVYDGTVFKGPASKYRVTADGEREQLRNGTERVWGSKVVFASIRTDDYHGRLVLDYEQVLGATQEGIGDEAASIITSATRLKREMPGIRGIIVDSIIRGTHLTQLADRGVLVTNYPHAKANPKSSREGRWGTGRKEKRSILRTFKHEPRKGQVCEHTLIVEGAVFKQPAYDATGRKVLTECPVTGFESRRNPSGGHRYYLNIKMPCPNGDLKVTVPLYHEDRDKFAIKGINRGEYLRFYPPGTPQFHALYGRRNDSESLHSQVKRNLTRLPAYRARRQVVFVLGMALVSNAAARAFDLKRAGEPNPLDDA